MIAPPGPIAGFKASLLAAVIVVFGALPNAFAANGLTDDPAYQEALEKVKAAVDLFDDLSDVKVVPPHELRFTRLERHKETRRLLQDTKEAWKQRLADHKASTFTDAKLADYLQRLETALYRYREGSGWELEHPQEEFASALKKVDSKLEAKKPKLADIGNAVDDVRYGVALLEYAGVTGEQLENARKLYEQSKAKAEQAGAALADKAAPPRNSYGNSDRKHLAKFIKSEWARRYPKEQVLEVFLAGKWERETGARRVSDQKVVKFDASVLHVSVATKRDEKIADVWRASLEKDHLQQDRMSLLRDPFGQTFVAIKNLKK